MPEIFDLTEAQFYLGEIARIIPMWEDALKATEQPIESIKDDLKPYKAEIKRLNAEMKPLKEELADWQTKAGEYRARIQGLKDSQREIESIIDKLITEPEATRFITEQAKAGRFDFMDEIHHKPNRMVYTTPSIYEYRQMEKALITLAIKHYDRGWIKDTELYMWEVWEIPDSYIEFFTTLNVPAEEDVEEKV